MMSNNPIATHVEYRHALREIETLMVANAGTPDGEPLEVLVTLVEAWERKYYPMDDASSPSES